MNKVNAVIMARAGSERFPNKNIQKIWGHQSILWVYEAVRRCSNVYEIAICTDYKLEDLDDTLIEQIKEGHLMYHNRYEVDRMDSKLVDAIQCAKKIGFNPNDPLLILQGNSPDITTELIDEVIKGCQEGDRAESITVDSKLNQVGVARCLRKLGQTTGNVLSYKLKCIVTTCVDIHTAEEFYELEKDKVPGHLRGITPTASREHEEYP